MTNNNQPTRCECDELAEDFGVGFLYDPLTERPYVAHLPNQCKCVNDLKLCHRAGKILWLCSNCRVASDEEVSEPMQEFIKQHEFLHAEAWRARRASRTDAREPTVYVLIHDNGYEDTQVYGVFTSKNRAERYVQEYVNDHEGEGKDDFVVERYNLDRLYND